MTDENILRRFFALVSLRGDSDLKRIGADAPVIIETLRRASTGEFESVCRSKDGLLFGFFLMSKLPARIIRLNFEGCTGTGGDDAFLIFEVGDDWSGIGFSRAWTWLQRHQA